MVAHAPSVCMGPSVPWLRSTPVRPALDRVAEPSDSGPMTADLPPIPTYAEVEKDPGTLHAFNERIIDEFRACGGTVGGPFQDSNVLLLTVIGAKSGRKRVIPLEYFTVDGRLFLVGTFGGAPKNPAWVHNLRANAHARIEIGTQSYGVVAHELPPQEGAAVLADIAARLPRLARYPKPDRVIPVFELLKAEPQVDGGAPL